MGRKRKTQNTTEEQPMPAVEPAVDRGTDRHKNKKMARIPDDLHQALMQLGKENDRHWTWELYRAIRAHLRSHGKLPDEQSE